MLSAEAVHDQLVDAIMPLRQRHGLVVVGINGMAGSGKTTLAGALVARLRHEGVEVCPVSVDDFHNSRAYRYRRGPLSPEGYYRDSINFDAFRDGVLRSAFEALHFPVSCQTKHWDLERDMADQRNEELAEGSVVLAEGIFLFRPELAQYMHLRIYVHADEAVIIQRVRSRDLALFGSAEATEARYRHKYLPGERLYHAEVAPADVAHFHLDNNDVGKPVLTRLLR